MAAASLHECTQVSLKTWQDDLVRLFQNAKDRYPDVVWEVGEDVDDDENITPDVDEVWGHKAIVYARAPPSFQSRYFQFRPSNTTSLSLALSDSFSRSPSPSRNPTPQTISQGLTRLRTAISTVLFSNELEYLYTGQGFGEAFQFLFDEDGAGGIDETDSAEIRIDKLRRDLVFMWRSRLYSDVRIALSNEHEPSTAVFSTHKFILVSRSSYFAKLLSASSSHASRDETQTLTLPSPPHTPASLHFTLGYLYTGTLSFSHRTYDLSTALSILLTSSSSYLNLPALHVEIRSRIVIEMAHGLFHAFLPFAEYDSLLNRGGTGGCKCRQCARRIPRILSFALQPTLQDAILERGARRALVGLFGDGWCTQEFAELDPKIRESVIRGVRKRMWKEFEGDSANATVKGRGLFALLFAAESALAGRLTQVLGYNGEDDEILEGELPANTRKPWATIVRNDLLTARKSIDECLAECVEDCLSPPPSTTASLFIPNAQDLTSSSQLGGEEPEKEAEGLNEFHLLLLRSPHTPSYTDALHLQFILSSLLRGLSHSNAPVVYQTLVSNVLLLPSITDPEQSMQEFGAFIGERRALLGETNYVRIQVEEARVEVMKWIKGRWRRVRDLGGFLLKGNTIRIPPARNGDSHSLPPIKGSEGKDVEEREGQMELWAVQEISDYIQIPLDDLLAAPTTPVSAYPSSQSLHPVKSGKGSDDTSSVISRSGVSVRSGAPSLKSGAPSFRSGVSSRSGALSPAGRRNGALSPTGGSLTGTAKSGALSPTSRIRALSPTMRVSTLSKNLPPTSQKRIVSSSASSVRSLRSTTSVSTTTTTTRKSAREIPAKVDKANLGVRKSAGERPDSKFTEVEDKNAEMLVPDVVVGDADMQDDTRSTSPSTSTSVSPHPSPSKGGQAVLTPKASIASLSSTYSTQSNHTSAHSTSTSISPKQRRGSSHSTASVASTIRRAHAAAAKASSTALKVSPSYGKRPVSSASTATSTTASSVSGEYRTASATSGPMNRSTSGSTSTSNSQRKRTTSGNSARSVSGVSIRSVGGASVRSVSSPRMARKSSVTSSAASATSSRPPSVAASIRSKKEVAPPLPTLKKKGSSDTIKTVGGTVTKATASSAAKATQKTTAPSRKFTTPKMPEEPRDPPPHLHGATLDIGIPCIVQATLPPPPSSSTLNGSKLSGRKKFKALAKYIGQVEGEDGSWVGVEVPSASSTFSASTVPSPNLNTDVEMSDSGISIPPSLMKSPKNSGWHDGTYQGIRYFTLSAPAASSSNKKEQWGDADETPAGGYYLSSHKKFASAGVGTVRKRVETEVGGTVGRNNKRLKIQSSGGAAEKRGLFVRPQQVLYVVDAIDGDDEL
ncbi:hypothetical protein E1B28_006100 [Marasmius oreades]|uniref:BTB domain-containing protein n=1 Tax=Marasmius oreades TaxID=181124 RepID=A0A9P7S768_9AGAR|nr:uncharacterized protein E1B28_006100 [Marasmius oreades]KAG7095338.1 hypothetical protein E1B28_006100 [Marasmius oreades]